MHIIIDMKVVNWQDCLTCNKYLSILLKPPEVPLTLPVAQAITYNYSSLSIDSLNHNGLISTHTFEKC